MSAGGRAEALLARLPQTGIEPGLERIEKAARALGVPQGRYPSILVAGTNGKGSTCAFLSSCLVAAGLRVGLATSPHLVSFRERIRLDGVPVDDATVDRALSRIEAAWPRALREGDPDRLSYFEVVTLLALSVFAEQEVDVAILEVGLGGRWDAANLAGTQRLASVMAPIALDHQDWLGEGLAAIAREKAAVAREGVPLVVGPQPPEARDVLREVATERGAPWVEMGACERGGPAGSPGARPQTFSYRGPRWRFDGLEVGMLGAHQVENACLAVTALEALADRLPIGEDALRRGLAEARWPGRLEVVAERPLVLLDGAHNPAAVRKVVASFSELFGTRPLQLVFGVLDDKERDPMMRTLFPSARGVHLCAPDSPRAVPATRLAEEAAELGLAEAVEVRAHTSLDAAIEAAREAAGEEGAVLVCGSLYLVGEARRLLVGPER